MSYSSTSSYKIKWKLKKLWHNFFPAKRVVLPAIEKRGAFNRILDNDARKEYQPIIDILFRYSPEIMNRKIPEANVQQAFILDTAIRFAYEKKKTKMLCVGCFEDTAAETLEQIGYHIDSIDPVLNYDLGVFFNKFPQKRNTYDVIFSTSVIEHVQDDELFVKQIAELLAPGGTAIITCDYNDQYKPGDPIPEEDFRLYTQKDFTERLLPLISDCSLVDSPQWDCLDPDFVYAGCRYTFATFVFRKKI